MTNDASPSRDSLVPWVTYGALLRSDIEDVDGLALAEGVHLVPFPEWARSGDVLKYMSERTRQSLGKFKHALSVEYQADSLGMPDLGWGPDEDGKPRSVQQHAERRLILAALALWLARPTRETIKHIVHARCDNGEWFVPQVRGGVDVVCAHPRDANAHMDAQTIRAALPLHEALLGLREGGPLFVALAALLQGLRAESTLMRFLTAWVAAEAVFGAAQEVTFRLSSRVAAFLRPNGPERQGMFKIVKDGYRWRSKVVHGTGLAKFTHEVWLRESHALETWLREALRKILLDAAITESIESKRREDYLDEMQFAASPAAGQGIAP